MTAIPTLRPPRRSPATAYLRHLQRRRTTDRISSASVAKKDVAVAEVVGDFFFSAAAAASSPPRRPLTITRRTTSDSTCVSCGNNDNNNVVDDYDGGSSNNTEPNSEESCSSHFLVDLDDDLPTPTSSSSPPASATERPATVTPPPTITETSTALVPVMTPSRVLTSQVIAVDDEDGSFALEALLSQDNDENAASNDDDDCDSVEALDRLLTETSQRWTESCQRTHRDFCRVPGCDCKTQGIIERQAAEIETLRAQLDEAHLIQGAAEAANDYPYNNNNNNNFHHHGHGGGDDEPREDVLPIEQIEVYHDSDDHLSVTSGLTHVYDLSRVDDVSIFQQQLQQNKSDRPDAEVETVNQPSRVRDYQVEMMMTVNAATGAADGGKATCRKASYSGPLYKNKPHGCGILKFKDTGDVYMGDLVMGEMHGQGTYTCVASSSSGASTTKQHKVLKGIFENNVYVGTTGWDVDTTEYYNSTKVVV